eukprot:546366-Pelagomonas_calceolata.AAC.1
MEEQWGIDGMRFLGSGAHCCARPSHMRARAHTHTHEHLTLQPIHHELLRRSAGVRARRVGSTHEAPCLALATKVWVHAVLQQAY